MSTLKKYKDNERPYGKCYDCKKPYREIPDIMIPDEIWEKINPTYHEGAGILCPNCIGLRLRKLGIYDVPAKYMG